MKFNITLLAVLAALTIAGQASAQTTLLLSDSFDTPGFADGGFNGPLQLGDDQAGALATKDYSISSASTIGVPVSDTPWAFQRGNDNDGAFAPSWLMFANQTFNGIFNLSGSVNNNFATQANTLGQALEFSFNMTVVDSAGGDVTNWSSFGIGSVQNAFVAAGSNKFASLFRENGRTQQFAAGSGIGNSATYTAGQQIKFVISDASGAGSAFTDNGATDMVKMYIGGTLANTFANLNLGANDGNITFMTYNAVSYIDNLSVTAIPEPSSALLAGLGALSLVIILRRRRAQAQASL